MNILFRYVWREAFLFFGLCLFAFTGILLTLRMLRFASLVVDKGVEISQIASVFLAIVPTFLEIAIPLATLLGIMLAFGRLSGDSEIVVMRASGISIGQLAWPALGFGILAGLAGLLVSLELKPLGYRHLSQTLFEIARSKSTSGIEPGIFNKLGEITLYAEDINDMTGDLSHVLVDDRRSAEVRRIFFASTGSIRSDETRQTIEFILRDAEIHEQGAKPTPPWRSAEIRLSVDPNQLFEQEQHKSKTIAELSVSELRERIAYLQGPLLSRMRETPRSYEIGPPIPPNVVRELPPPSSESLEPEVPVLHAAQYPLPIPASVLAEPTTLTALEKRLLRSQIELGQRFSLPFAAVALALLAMPLGIQPPRAHRTWGAGLSALLGLLVFVIYYGLFSMGLVVAQSGGFSPLVALWIPNVFVVGLALFAIHRTATERWHSVAAALHDHAARFVQRLRQLLWRPRTA